MKWGVGLWFWLLALPCYSATTNDILRTAWSDDFYVSQINRISPSTANPFRNVELTASQETDADRETEVGLKFQIKSYPEWKLRNTSKDAERAVEDFSLSWALQTRYLAIMKHKVLSEKMKCAQIGHEHLKRWTEAQGVSLKAGRASGKTFTKARLDMIKNERLIRQLEYEILQNTKLIQQWDRKFKDKDYFTSPFHSTKVIERIVQEVAPDKNETLSYKLGHQEIDQLQKEIEVVQGKEDQWFKSIGVSKKNKKDEDVYEVQVSIQLPFLFSDESAIQKKNELVFKRAQKKRDLEEREGLTVLRTKLLNTLTDFEAITSEDNRIGRSAIDPLEKLEEKIAQGGQCIDAADLQLDFYTQYIQFLLESEVLAKQPQRNFLFQEGPIS